jgi:hypothetical protein
VKGSRTEGGKRAEGKGKKIKRKLVKMLEEGCRKGEERRERKKGRRKTEGEWKEGRRKLNRGQR